MDLLVFDAKRNGNHRHVAGRVPVALNKEDLEEVLGFRRIDAFLNGGLVEIFDETASRIIHEMSGIGQWLKDERKESRGVSRSCFSQSCGEPNGKLNEQAANEWAELSPIARTLVLTPIETALLSIDWKIINVVKNGKISLSDEEIWTEMRNLYDNPKEFGKVFSVFRFLKMNGWIVTSGHTFGCDYLIYCLGAEFYHSSAGVLIADVIDPRRLLTLTRILSHNKKALIVATTTSEVECFEDANAVDVKISTMKTYFLERDVAQMSNRCNEVYELNTVD
ncbi:tRNA-intron lyase [Caenorhabditis elegans]|uniref:tRNA-intron lyase n=1 Tax=Caenorhabditis elegans TaxID=6239 RepID=Q9U218_CAEEL|nr:tRNA-intron lyase [Caenorhabditis elegans]CAB60523.3 tRNA-intron lyase [Caenorhabditis elegans]|eukprot:NP_499543.2 Trna (tRNA) Splicing ENdonuclease subunit related [Caenorhabditis elegans]